MTPRCNAGTSSDVDEEWLRLPRPHDGVVTNNAQPEHWRPCQAQEDILSHQLVVVFSLLTHHPLHNV